ncbi:MAG: methyltransferase domain-containing protein [Proteobacteria bacterium]|nr:methyltransferase domain-containing protein [Pseudomonadota bacterium]
MRGLESLRGDFGVLRAMLRGIPKHGSHAQNLQGFYGTQAGDYDRFRERLLQGRAELIARLQLALPRAAHVVELGGGTGRNLEFFGTALDDVAAFDLVDLCPALLARARARFARHARVRVIEADATIFRPAQAVDCVYFSYALTMIPDWRAALDNACAMLKPGGVLGVVDFYHSTARPDAGLVRHGAFTRKFWRRWFAHDGVRLDPEHLAALRARFPRHELIESRAAVPYLPGLRVPYYVFVGRKA